MRPMGAMNYLIITLSSPTYPTYPTSWWSIYREREDGCAGRARVASASASARVGSFGEGRAVGPVGS